MWFLVSGADKAEAVAAAHAGADPADWPVAGAVGTESTTYHLDGPAVARAVHEAVPDGAALFLGSSSVARDLGRLLGCYGHVSALRRTRVGPFTEADSCQVAALEEAGPDGNAGHLHAVEPALDATGLRIAVACGRFNDHVTMRLLEGTRRELAGLL
mgnify:CR=1 FL=1